MADEKTSIFRKKTVESVQSPEVLDDYLKVTNPGIWIFLAAVAVLLIGVIIWGIFGSIDTKVNVAVQSVDDGAVCILPYDKCDAIINCGVVTVDGKEYTLSDDESEYQVGVIDDTVSAEILVKGEFTKGDYVVVIPLTEKPDNGVYSGSVVTEKLKPISLLLQ